MKFKKLEPIYNNTGKKLEYKRLNYLYKICAILLGVGLGLPGLVLFFPVGLICILFAIWLWRFSIRCKLTYKLLVEQEKQKKEKQLETERVELMMKNKSLVIEKQKEQEELTRKLKEEQEKYNIRTYKVVGISFHKEDLMELAEENICYDYTKKEILDELMYNERIYQYDFYPNKVELVPEPTNEYDPNAVKVMVDNIHIGYIKKGNCKHILNLINEKRIKSITCDIYGGKYKILEYEGEDDIDFVDNPKLKDFTLYKDETEYGAKVTIKELKRVGQ